MNIALAAKHTAHPLQTGWEALRVKWERCRAIGFGSLRWEQHLRWGFRALCHPKALSAWFTWLGAPDRRPWLEKDPDLPFKPLRGFQSTRWNVARRIKVAQDTLKLMQESAGALREAYLAPKGVALTTLPLPNGEPLPVSLGFHERFRKEGLLLLCLGTPEEGGWICALALAFERQPSGLCCTIGCVQGRSESGDTVRDLTKALHGLRPKAFMVFLAQILAEALGAERLRGIGTAIHPAFRHRRGSRPTFDYDALWLESGGTRAADGWFDLPLAPRSRTADEIKPHKRAMYAKRYRMLDGLARDLRAALAPAR